MINIKNQLSDTINSHNFKWESSNYRINDFRSDVNKFLIAEDYSAMERYAHDIAHFLTLPHLKVPEVGDILNTLNNYEYDGNYEFEDRRLHFPHQIYVFIIGLYIYNNNNYIQSTIREEIKKSTKEIQVRDYKDNQIHTFRYSNGSIFGEFLFRWKFTCLLHDIGSPISLAYNNQDKIREYLNRISRNYGYRINNINELINFHEVNLLQKINSKLPELSLSDYMSYQASKPFPGDVCHDHGIISALIFLYTMHDLYSRHLNGRESFIEQGVVWHSDILETSLLHSSAAIALHNLDYYEDAYNNALIDNNYKVFDFEKRPLCCLLKLADMLHEWDKPNVSDTKKELENTNVRISFSNDAILLENYPDNKRKSIIQFIEKYLVPTNLIKFIN